MKAAFQLEISIGTLDALFQEIGGYALFVCSAYKGQYLYMSDAMQKIDGYPAQKHLEGGLDFMQSITHPDDYPYCVKHFVHQMNRTMAPDFDRSQTITATNSYRVRHAAGHYVWTINSYLLLDFEEGKPNRLIGVFKETTEEKQKELFLWHHLAKEIKSAIKLEGLRNEFENLGNDFNPKYLSTETAGLLHVPFGKWDHENITEREKEVLRLISNGYSDRQVADKLSISHHTAINHRKNLIQKFGVKNTAALVKAASKSYWL